MELRAEAATVAAILIAFALAPAAAGQDAAIASLRVRHGHLRKSCVGTLIFTAKGVSYAEDARRKARKKPHAWSWDYGNLQQLMLASGSVRLLTYDDVRWRLGADRELRFDLLKGQAIGPVDAMLASKLDRRFISAVTREAGAVWRMGAKQKMGFGGPQGALVLSADRLAFEAARPGEPRTWRFVDIDNVSTEGPFQLTVTTFERARNHYGSRKNFSFQLKETLTDERFNDLWRRIEASRGASVLSTQYTKGETNI